MENRGRSLLDLKLDLVILQLRVLPPGCPLYGLEGLVGLNLVKSPARGADQQPPSEEQREARGDPLALPAPDLSTLANQLNPSQQNFTTRDYTVTEITENLLTGAGSLPC